MSILSSKNLLATIALQDDDDDDFSLTSGGHVLKTRVLKNPTDYKTLEGGGL